MKASVFQSVIFPESIHKEAFRSVFYLIISLLELGGIVGTGT